MRRSVKAVFWILVYLFLIFSPLIVLFIAPRPEGREFWRDFSVMLGFVGLSLMGFQFIPTARLPFLANVFPLDELYFFHHQISILSFALALAHPIILFINNPYTLRLLNVFTAPWRARAAVGAVVGLIVIIVTSVWRKQLKISYEGWRIGHDLVAIAILGLSFWHILGVNYYMSMPVQRVLWIGLAVVWGGLLGYIRLYKPWWMLRHPYEVSAVIPERGNSWSFVLKPVGHEGFDFRAGQVAWLTVDRSPFRIREHPFSITSSAEGNGQLSFGIRELGDFTSTIGDIEEGTRVYVDGPYGTFSAEQSEAPGYVFIAGGIGSAPFLSILRTMADRGDEHPVTFIYGCPTWEGVIFREEIERLKGQLNLDVVYVLEHPPEDWDGETGYITPDVLDRHIPEDRGTRDYFICGPILMLDLVEEGLRQLDVPLPKIHTERYEMA